MPDEEEKNESRPVGGFKSRASNGVLASKLSASAAMGVASARNSALTDAFVRVLWITSGEISILGSSFADPGYGILSAQTGAATIKTTPPSNRAGLNFIWFLPNLNGGSPFRSH